MKFCFIFICFTFCMASECPPPCNSKDCEIVLVPHPEHCDKFFYCSPTDTQRVLFHCPQGSVFNEETQVNIHNFI